VSAALLPALTIVCLGIAARLVTRPADACGWSHLRSFTVWAPPAILAIIAFTIPVVWPIKPESWRPPPGIQMLRHLGLPATLACGMILMGWWIDARLKRKRPAPRFIPSARDHLAILMPALVVVTWMMLIALVVNHRLDGRHVVAFGEAAGDLVADRLGPDWLQNYFVPARDAAR
jgi:hypothetical protein